MATSLRKLHTAAVLLLVLGLAGVAGVAGAQDSDWRPFVSVSPVFEEADLDAGGNVSVSGVLMRAGTSRGFGDGNRAGITLTYDYIDYSFDNPTAFGGVAPWNALQRYGISAPLSFAMSDGWTLGVTPSVDWFKENGAKSSDALAWGATFSAVKRFADGKVLGFGLGAFDRIEETKLIPLLIVDWRFNKHWRLINPLPAGPTGGAGLELDYLFDNGWTMGAGFAYRESRFRLSESGPVANGIGVIKGAPVYLRASRAIDRTFTLNAYIGAVAGGELRVENPSGNLLRKEEFDLAPFVGFNITARF